MATEVFEAEKTKRLIPAPIHDGSTPVAVPPNITPNGNLIIEISAVVDPEAININNPALESGVVSRVNFNSFKEVAKLFETDGPDGIGTGVEIPCTFVNLTSASVPLSGITFAALTSFVTSKPFKVKIDPNPAAVPGTTNTHYLAGRLDVTKKYKLVFIRILTVDQYSTTGNPAYS